MPIPDDLWDDAVEVARDEGVEATALALGLDRGRLARRLEARATSSGASEGFVEIDTRGLCASGKTVLRFEGRDGERLQIELSAGAALDVVDLARAFWIRPR